MTKLTLFPWLGLCAVPLALTAAITFPLAGQGAPFADKSVAPIMLAAPPVEIKVIGLNAIQARGSDKHLLAPRPGTGIIMLAKPVIDGAGALSV